MKRTQGYSGSLVENCLQSCHVALDFGANQARLGIQKGVSHALFAAENEIYIVLRFLPQIADIPQRKRCSVDLEMILIRFCALRLQIQPKYYEA
jgi:hypothetical protein